MRPLLEIHAWWFLWPGAVRAVCASWQAPERYRNARVGLIENAKRSSAA
jgi:hypothetical protein